MSIRKSLGEVGRRAAALGVALVLVGGAFGPESSALGEDEEAFLEEAHHEEAHHEGHSLDFEFPEFEHPESPDQQRIRAGISDGVGQRGVAHAGGRLIAGAAAPTGETRSTGYLAVEPTLGIFEDGTIVYMGVGDLIAPAVAKILRSRDQGRTWQELDLVPGSREDPVGQDPFLRVDRATGRMFQMHLTPPCTAVFMSDDEGDTFSTGTVCNHTDHQNLWTGKPVTSTTSGYPKVIYYCAYDGGALVFFSTLTGCSKSLDGGRTFVRTGAPPYGPDPASDGGYLGTGHCDGGTGHGVADAAGTIFLPRGYCGQPFVAISHDEGATWERVQVADNGVASDRILGHEASMAVDTAGNLYYTWIAVDRLPYLVSSRDHGATWSAPVRISPPKVNEAWGAFVDAGAPGRIAVNYVGTTNSPGGPFCVRPLPPFLSPTDCETAAGDPPRDESEYDNTTWDGYISVTVDALSPDPVFLTAAVTPPGDPLLRGGTCEATRCGAQYDFLDTEIAPDGTPWAAFVDACGEDPKEACASIGIGVVARLKGGPPLYGPLPESAKPPLVLPPPRNAPAECAPRRRFTLGLSAPLGKRLRSARVFAAGHTVTAARRDGQLFATIDLSRFQGDRVTIRVLARTKRGREARFKRSYPMC
ncbi:MAG TPA: sialidase family protein [Actinomycetota bacterium]|nr:sialidase family protein [Actinomycetota bacterium]